MSDPNQERSRAAKYQVSPDLQHVLFAFDVKAVSGGAARPPPHPLLGLLLDHNPDGSSLQVYRRSFVAKYIIYSLVTQ